MIGIKRVIAPDKTYGELWLDGEVWKLTCEPHVTMMAKRVFQRIPRGAAGVFELSDNPETCRLLQWFNQLYPLKIKHLKRLERSAATHVHTINRLSDIIGPGYQPRSFTLAEPLREYQNVAVDLYLTAGSLLLADDVGLGKTASAIGSLSDSDTLPALVVCPAHLTRQWEREINRFAPKLTTHVLKKGSPYQLPLTRRGTPDVLISSYHKMSGWADTLGRFIKSVIFDEGQELRKSDSQKYTACRHVAWSARYRIALTATPIYNYGGEIYNVLNVTHPNKLGDWDEFSLEWCNSGDRDKASLKDPGALGSWLREQGIMLRRTRRDVARELPPLSKETVPIDCNAEALHQIEDAAHELANIIMFGSGGLQKMQAASELDNMVRQATGIAKCLAVGTKVIKFDGSVVPVETLSVGDLLMGPDSKPRRILGTTSGRDEMFEVRSTSLRPLFKPYIVNGNHILALKHSGKIRRGDRYLFGRHIKGDHIEIAVRNYVKKSAHFKRMLKGYKSIGIDFPARPVPLDPYFLGLWLGDGSSASASITTMDREIREYVHQTAEAHKLTVRVKQPERTAPTYCLAGPKRGCGDLTGKSRNPIRKALRRLGILGRKSIPLDYLVNDRTTRMAVLAGLIDTDGSLNAGGGYSLSTKWQHLSDEICWLAQSLGFKATSVAGAAKNQSGKSFRHHKVMISGNGLEELPVRIPRKRAPLRKQIKDPLRSGIAVQSVGMGDYFGFELDGDGLFLLEDFTVTHNSPHVAAYVEMLLDNGEPVVLFGWHRAVYDLWASILAKRSPAFYTGSESPAKKQFELGRFLEGQTDLLIVSLRSGAGLDGLQHRCRTVVFGELDWSPGVHEQCVGRVFRDGQKDPVTAYFLIADEGSDPMVVEVCGIKREQVDGLRNQERGPIEQVAPADGIRRLAERYATKQRR